MELKGKKALVMGLGLHDGGFGVTRFLAEQGAEVTVTDLRPLEVLRPTVEKLAGLPVKFVLGEHREEDFRQADLVIKNPAVPRDSRFIQVAREAGALIEMELTLFFKLCPSKNIIGITGTRGKTSTTFLAGEIFQTWKPETVLAGNLRVSALSKLNQITPGTPVILELSSWQLEGLGEQHLSPLLALVTNLSPDHLNRYQDMEDYANAKRNIYRWQDPVTGTVILNREDPVVSQFAEDAPGKVIYFSVEPPLNGQPGAFVKKGNFIWQSPENGPEEEILAVGDFQLPGRHNLQNALAAIALAKMAGCPVEYIQTGLKNFKGVPDRQELVREVAGIKFYNDTTATSPAGVVAALEALKNQGRNIILLAGGADKKLEFSSMAQAIANKTNRVSKVLLLQGTATPRLLQALEETGLTGSMIEGPFDNLNAAVQRARDLACEGDLVLLSPGCASFGMFTHEFDRGNQFREIVGRL